MDNGMDQYYSYQPNYDADQSVYNTDIPLYNADYPAYGSDVPVYPSEIPMSPTDNQDDTAPTELPPEPDDSPYEDPVVRHILSLKNDKYRRTMLSYLHENVKPRTNLHPATIMLALLVCFPVGLCMMYFGTQWGTFAKVVITVFTLLMALAVYEILVLGGNLPTPSLIETVGYIFSQLFA